MGKNKKILIVIGAVFLLLINIAVLLHKENVEGEYKLTIDMKANKKQDVQVFFSQDRIPSEDMSSIGKYENAGANQQISFMIPSYAEMIRVDFGTEPDHFEIRGITLSYKGEKADILEIQTLKELDANEISEWKAVDGILEMITDGTDAYVWFDLPNEKLYQELEKDCERKGMVGNIVTLLLLDGVAVCAIVFRKKLFGLPIELLQNKGLILNLSKNDFKTKYAGSYLGIVWAFIQPVVTILVYWFVFSVGLKAGNASDYPFVLYLVSGIVPWFFFQDALNGGTNALIEYNYLVKKVVFKISILPIVKIISAFFVHVFFVTFALILCWLYGYVPGVHSLQIAYYSACTFLLVLGMVYATSAIVVFFRDLTQIINIFLQIGVWLTPIMWDVNMLKDYPWLIKVFKLNPMYYIVSGYRDAMLSQNYFWEQWGWTLYFWTITVVLFVLGSVIFKRLKPHFADVL